MCVFYVFPIKFYRNNFLTDYEDDTLSLPGACSPMLSYYNVKTNSTSIDLVGGFFFFFKIKFNKLHAIVSNVSYATQFTICRDYYSSTCFK